MDHFSFEISWVRTAKALRLQSLSLFALLANGAARLRQPVCGVT
jgi:hypothetical protein